MMRSPEAIALGAEVYEMNCAQCHYAGEGSDHMPALIGDPKLRGDDASGLIRVILRGQQGVSEVNGRKLNGFMPPHGFLSDEEIAAVASYVRDQFGEGASSVTPDEVAALR